MKTDRAAMTDWVLPEILRQRAEECPDEVFLEVVGEDGAGTYRQTYEATRRTAAGLRDQGVRKGDFVSIMAVNSSTMVHTWFAINMLGAIEVPLNPGYRGQPLIHALNLSESRLLVIDQGLLPALRDVEDSLPHLEHVVVIADGAAPDVGFERLTAAPYGTLLEHGLLEEDYPDGPGFTDIASVIYTSGTTGPAKGVLMPHAQTYVLALNLAEGVRFGPDDTYYTFHPMFHMAGKFMGVYAAMIARGRVVMDTTFAAEHWLERIREYGATLTGAHGPMLEMVYALPEAPDDADNPLRALMSAPFPAGIAEDFERRFGVRGLEVWGMTEVNTCSYTPYDAPLTPGASGKPLDEWYEVRIVDPATDQELSPGQVGEIVVRPRVPFVISQGYLGMPEATVEAWRNLWFHTSDGAYMDEEGYLYFVDRLKDRIRRRAENISSYDIEVAANGHPDVLECAAVGVDSGFDSDDDIKLCVVLGESATVSGEDLLRYLAPNLPHYMLPRYIDFLDELPRTPTNKVRKQVLRAGDGERLWDRKEAGIDLRKLVEESVG